MLRPARKLAAVILVATADCAQAPGIDGEEFIETYRPAFEAGSTESGGDGVDASLAEPSGSHADVPGGVDASMHDAGGSTPSGADSAIMRASDAAAAAGSEAGGTDASSVAQTAASDASASPDAAARASDAAADAAPREAAAATCSPLTCNNNCLLFPRCCNEQDQCACLDPATRQCSLPSL